MSAVCRLACSQQAQTTHGAAPPFFFALVLFALSFAVGAVAGSHAADAGWLTRLARDAGDAADGAIRRSAGDLDALATAAAKLPKRANETVLAATPGNAGHWTLRNLEGETFTASTAAEMKRGIDVLAPEARRRNVTFVIDSRALLENRKALAMVPAKTELAVLHGRETIPVVRAAADPTTGAATYALKVRTNVLVPVTTRAAYTEALSLLARKRTAAQTTILSLTRGTPSTPALNPTTRIGGVVVRAVDASALAAAIPALERRTAILVGSADNGKLTYRTASGGSETVDLGPVRRAAAEHDVSLVILDAAAARQPGQRNWLWQTAGVDRLEAAIRQPTYADMLNTLAGSDTFIRVDVAETRTGRAVLTAVAADARAVPDGGGLFGEIVSNILSETAGQVVTNAIQMDMPDRARQSELDMRILPGVPSLWQFLYLGSLALGVMGLGFARTWWRRVWPHERRAEYGNRIGYVAARVVRVVLFMVVWLPLVGIPAAIAAFATQVLSILVLPFVLAWRAVMWVRRRLRGADQPRASSEHT